MTDPSTPPPMPTLVRGGASGGDGRARRPPPPPRAPRPLVVAGLLAVLALVFVVAPAMARRATDWLWFREVGYERVFLLKIAAQWTLALVAGLGGFAVLYANARAALRGLDDLPAPPADRLRLDPRARERTVARVAGTAALPACVLLALLLALVAAAAWRTVVQFLYRSPFGVTDPVFGRDVSHYVFTVPLVEGLLDVAFLALVLSLLVVVPIYLARGEIALRGRSWRVDALARGHLAVLAAAMLAVVGLDTLLVKVPGILLSQHAPLVGAAYTDLAVRLPALRLLGGAALLGAAYVLWGMRRGDVVRRAVVAVGLYAALALLGGGLVPAVFQRLAVQPNELARETPQIRRHVEATRRAWGLDRVTVRELASERRLTAADVAAHASTIRNVRLWDREPLLQTFGQLQAIRTYYDFVAVDDDRYVVDGELRQVMLSARELNAAALPTRTFINEHLTFTHGMGLTLGPTNQVTPEGLPVLWVKDLPPASSIDLRVTRPQLYYGELANDFVLAPSGQREFDFPAGEGDGAAYSRYDGRGGVPVGSLGRRLLFALRFGSLNILLSRDVTPATKVLFHRSVRERAELALPFVRFDEDPYLVVADDGKLHWILDAYTTTDRYPYAQRLRDGTNYMRNSVKVVVDAYDGTIRAYLADPADPMIRTLARIYPGLLRPLAEMPADMRAHLRYPTDLFLAQTSLYATYHMTDPETFYHREDQWQIPAVGAEDPGEGFMRHMVMRLPGEAEPEFILMRPFTPRQKDNLAAWMVARNDGERYGELVAYRFPRQSLVFGPRQVVNRINQDTEVARQLSLWDQAGSQVIRGELLVIPIEEALVYVQPLYLRAEGGRIPELKRVIVALENRVAMEATLEAGLQRLLGGAASTLATDAPADTGLDVAPPAAPDDTTAAPTAATGAVAVPAELLQQALRHHERARAAQRAEDWATYGAEMRRLGEVLERLNAGRGPG